MKVDAQSLFNAIGEVNNLLAQLDAFHASCKDCLQLTKQFFALAAGAGVTGSTSVDFSSGYVFFSDALKSIGEMINNFYKSLDYNSTIIGKSIGELGTAGFNLEYGFTSIGGSAVHLNSNYVNANSIVSGIAIQDSSGKVVGSIVFSNIDGGKYVVKNSDGTTTTYTEAELSNWLSKYYDKNGNLSENYKMNYLIGNKDSNNNVSSMAWVEGKSIGVGVSLEAPVYESTVFDENGKEKNPTPVSETNLGSGNSNQPAASSQSGKTASGGNTSNPSIKNYLEGTNLSGEYFEDTSLNLTLDKKGKLKMDSKGNVYGYSGAWCAQYAWDTINKVSDASGGYSSASTGTTMKYFIDGNNGSSFHYNSSSSNYSGHKEADGSSYTPKAGDFIFFQWDGNSWNGDASPSGSQDHTGLVVDYDPETGIITTLEGNIGNTRVNRQISINSNYIIGYGSWY